MVVFGFKGRSQGSRHISRPCLSAQATAGPVGTGCAGCFRDGGGCRTSPAVDVRRPGFVSTSIHLSAIKQLTFFSRPVTSPGIQIRPERSEVPFTESRQKLPSAHWPPGKAWATASALGPLADPPASSSSHRLVLVTKLCPTL